MCQKIKILILLFVIAFSGFAQKEKVQNLPKFDHRIMHFGFLIGVNSANFSLSRYNNFSDNVADSIRVIEASPTTGFNLGIISSLHLNEHFSVRFTPNLAFAQRNIEYVFEQHDGDFITYEKAIESTLINFPLGVKMKSARLNNFSAYIIGGGAFSLDLASDKDAVNVSQELNDLVVKLDKYDYLGEVGFGTDFYLEYFKFGIELKMSYGIKSLLINDNTVFSTPIEKLRTKMFLLSFTFEG